jgi:hypothetical protein
MSCFSNRFRIAIGLWLFALACSGAGSPSAPTAKISPPPDQTVGAGVSARSTSSTHAEALEAVVGSGSGIVNVTPTAAVDGSFSAQLNVNVHGAPPNTTFYVQRAAEIGRENGADGICQRAAGTPPWGPPDPGFVTFPLPAAAPLVTLETSEGGSGAVHIDFTAPTIADGTEFDVMFRLVDSLTAPTNDLRTGCFTVTVK